MKIMVSACLLGENCKYNGGNNLSERVLNFVKGHEVIPVCPEVMGGLPTPRLCSEIVNDVVTASDGHSVDKEFRKGAQIGLAIAKENEVGKIAQEDSNHIFISGHMHEAFVHSNLNYKEDRSNLYLTVPSTSNLNIGGVVGYLIYMYPESNSMEISVLGCDNNLNIFEKDRLSWEFNKINNKCHRLFR